MSLRSIKMLSGKAISGLIIAICFACGVSAYGQLGTGQITGIVRDTTGAVVRDAQVAATQVDTGAVSNTKTNAEGLYSFPSLPVGNYTVVVSSQGFAKYSVSHIVLTVNQVYNTQITLQVAQTGETVTVAADAQPVETSDPAIRTLVGQATVSELPLNGRNPADLLLTVAGVTDAALNPTLGGVGVKALEANNPTESAPFVHGVHAGNTYFSLDGVGNLDPYAFIGGPFPNPDATQEFSVVTGSYGAGYASAASGAVNIVTRSGTNEIHGAVFEFLRNGYFNARNALSTQPDILKRNQFGAAAGAPLIKNRLFAFGSYQGTRITDSSTNTAFTPTADERQGIFPGFTIPSGMLSPSVQNLLPAIPLPSNDQTGYLSFQTPADNNEDQFVIKTDLDLKDHRLFLRYFSDHNVIPATGPTNGDLFNATRGTDQPYRDAALGDTYTRGNLVANTSLSYLSANSTTKSVPNSYDWASLGAKNISAGLTPGQFVLVIVNGFTYQGDGTHASYPRSVWELREDVIRSSGRQQLSFGINYQNMRFALNDQAGQNPVDVFVGVNSAILGQIPAAYGGISGAYFNPMADFMLGMPLSFSQNDGIYFSAKGNIFGAYAEDNVRVGSRLTLTAGLRFDPFFAYTPFGGRATCWIPGQQSKIFPNAPEDFNFAGDQNCSTAGYGSTINNIEPRVGLAYKLDSQGRSAIRAGYGMYTTQLPLSTYNGYSSQPWVRKSAYDQPFLSIDNIYGSYGNAIGQTVPNQFASGWQGPTYSPASDVSFSPLPNVAGIMQNFKPAYVQQFSLSFQQQITKADIVEAAYFGSSSTHLAMCYGLNIPVYGPGASISNEQARRPYQAFTNIAELGSDGNSRYNGLNLTLRHRVSGGITLTSEFNVSKAMDDSSTIAVTGQIFQPNLIHNFRYAPSDFNQTLTWRTTGLYNSPALAQYSLPLREALGSWSMSGILVLDSGQPFSIMDSDDNSYTGTSLDYADRVSGQPAWVNGHLNFAGFQDNAPGTFGDSGRNSQTSPGIKRIDAGISKVFPIRENLAFQFRAEAFNLLNHPNYEPPNAAWNTAAQDTFGAQLGARDPRIMQFSGKITF